MTPTGKKIFYRSIKADSAFTLVELVLVLAILSIMMAVALPNFKSWMTNSNLRGVVGEVYSDMQKAKMTAVKTNSTVTLSFTASTGTPCQGGGYVFTDGSGVNIANVTITDGICLSTTGTFPTGFTSKGLAVSTGSIQLSHPDASRVYTITVSSAGNVRLQ